MLAVKIAAATSSSSSINTAVQLRDESCLISGQSGSSPANCNCADAEHSNFRRGLFAHIRFSHGLGLALNGGLLGDLRLRHDGPRLGLNTASLHLRISYEQENISLSVLKRARTAEVVSRCQYGFSFQRRRLANEAKKSQLAFVIASHIIVDRVFVFIRRNRRSEEPKL